MMQDAKNGGGEGGHEAQRVERTAFDGAKFGRCCGAGERRAWRQLVSK